MAESRAYLPLSPRGSSGYVLDALEQVSRVDDGFTTLPTKYCAPRVGCSLDGARRTESLSVSQSPGIQSLTSQVPKNAQHQRHSSSAGMEGHHYMGALGGLG